MSAESSQSPDDNQAICPSVSDGLFKIGDIVTGTIKEYTKTGFMVDIGQPNLSFVPFNLLDKKYPRYLKKYLDKVSEFEIVNYSSKYNNYILNRASAIELQEINEFNKANEERLKNIEIRKANLDNCTNFNDFKIGLELIPKINNIKSYGMFVSLGKIEALLHVSNMNGKLPSEFMVDESVNVRILEIDYDSRKISVEMI